MSTADSSPQGPEPTGPATGPSGPGPDSSTSTDHVATFFASIRRSGFVRTSDRWIGGVASGVALRLGVDALLVRAAFGVLALISGAGLVLYALAWALLPEQSDGRIHLEETIRGRFDSAIAGAGVMLVVGLSWHPGRFGWWGSWGSGWFGDLFGIALLGFVIYLFVTVRRSRDGQSPGQGAAPGASSSTGTNGPGTGHASTAGTANAAGASHGAGGTGAGGGVDGASAPGWSARPSAGYVPYGPATPSVQASSWPVVPTSSATAPLGPSFVKGAPSAPQTGSVAPPPPRPAPPVHPEQRPRPGGPGRTAIGLVAGLALLGFAALLVADRTGAFDGDVVITSLGALAVLAGLGVVVSGLRGRKSGTLGFFAIVAVLVAGPVIGVQGVGSGFGAGTTTFLGDSDYRPTSAVAASEGYAVALGSTTIDLTDMNLPRGETVEVPVHVGAGDLTVVVPEGVPVSARINLGAGRIDWQVDGGTRSTQGVGRATTFESAAVQDGEDARIHVSIASGAGTITIEEAP